MEDQGDQEMIEHVGSEMSKRRTRKRARSRRVQRLQMLWLVAPCLFDFYFLFFLSFITEAVLSVEARIAYDRNTVINVRKGSIGIGLSAVDLDMITTHNIF